MAFKITEQSETQNYVTAEEQLWLTADRSELVSEEHPDAAFLFATPADEISMEDAERYGLIKPKKAAKTKTKGSSGDEERSAER